MNHRSLIILRRLVLVAFITSLSLVVWWLRSGDESESTAGELVQEPYEESDPEYFEWTASVEGEKYFRIEGKAGGELLGSSLEVHDVTLVLFRASGDVTVKADEATYDRDTGEGILWGDVRVSGIRGLSMRTEKLSLLKQGRILESNDEVHVTWGTQVKLAGTASHMRVNMDRKTFLFLDADFADIDDSEGTSLRSGRLWIEDSSDRRIVRAEKQVALKRKGFTMEAGRMAIHLEPLTDALEFVRAGSTVEFVFNQDEEGMPHRIIGKAVAMSVLFDPRLDEPRIAELEGLGRREAAILDIRGDGLISRVNARYLKTDFRAGTLDRATAIGRVRVDQGFGMVTKESLRVACANRAEIQFNQGNVGEVQLEGSVNIHENGLQLNGDHARMNFLTGLAEVSGDSAEVLTERGEFKAPLLTFREASGVVKATGGVYARLRGSSAFIPGALELDSPVQIKAEESRLVVADGSYSFQGGVRAWRGRDYLTADQLRGTGNGGGLSASGDVTTVWKIPGEDPRAKHPVRIESEILSYEDHNRTLTYDRQVKMTQREQTLSCKTMNVEIDKSGEVDNMTCREEVHMVDESTNRKVDASRVSYRIANEQAIFSGDPMVTVEEADGGRITSPIVTYSSDGRIHFYSSEDSIPQMERNPN